MSNVLGTKRSVDQYSKDQNDLVELANKRLKMDMSQLNGEMPQQELFERKVRPFKAFDYQDDYGIPRRLSILANVDVQNIVKPLKRWTRGYRKDISLSEFSHLYQYLNAREFNSTLLKDKTYDRVVDAIVSYMLDWSDESLKRFSTRHQQYTHFCEAIINFRKVDDGAYIYEYNGIPVVKTSMKLLKANFSPDSNTRNSFCWMSFVDNEFIREIRNVYDWALNDKFDKEKIAFVEMERDIPYTLPNIDIKDLLDQRKNTNCLKFVSGEACCCKTTCLEKIKANGWKIFSRGDVGSFGGKANNPAAIGNLHAALHFVLTQPDAIGDRGFIDNVIWMFIMEACNPARSNTLISDLLLFLNSNFNETAIAEYITHKGVIFLDPYPIQNKKRQLLRSEDGDSFRSRLAMYATAQFITYYVAARLFGWKIICVPYTKDFKIDNDRYLKNIETVTTYFGEPKSSKVPPIRFAKPSNLYEADNTFSKSVGIFK